MKPTDIINSQFNEIAENYIIPTNIEPILRNALAVRQELEDSFEDCEKEAVTYQRLKKSVVLLIAGSLTSCFARNQV